MGGCVGQWVNGESPQISNLQTKLKYLDWFKCIEFLLILGVPPGRWVYWGRGGYQCVEAPHKTCTCMHAYACTYMLNMINMDASMRAAICNFYTYVCVHVHACTCMFTCVGIPHHAPRCPHPSAPSPRATGSPKHQNSINLELIEII